MRSSPAKYFAYTAVIWITWPFVAVGTVLGCLLFPLLYLPLKITEWAEKQRTDSQTDWPKWRINP
jgi:hypothetical protein